MNNTFEKIDIEKALKMISRGESVYIPNEEENALCLFDIKDVPHCWKDIAYILLYTEFYKKKEEK